MKVKWRHPGSATDNEVASTAAKVAVKLARLAALGLESKQGTVRMSAVGGVWTVELDVEDMPIESLATLLTSAGLSVDIKDYGQAEIWPEDNPEIIMPKHLAKFCSQTWLEKNRDMIRTYA